MIVGLVITQDCLQRASSTQVRACSQSSASFGQVLGARRLCHFFQGKCLFVGLFDSHKLFEQLETDENILLEKARKALNRYGHKLVIANELNSRKEKVTLVTASESESIRVDASQNIEIEKLIVANVVKRHSEFISST